MQITTESISPNVAEEIEFWNFVAHRQKIFAGRTWYPHEPHLNPEALEILKTYRFTNVYRMCDRHSRYIIAVMENPTFTTYAQLIEHILIFRYFNKIETYGIVCEVLNDQYSFIGKLTDLRNQNKNLFASFYHPKHKTGTTITEVLTEQVMTLFGLLGIVENLEHILTELDTDNWSQIFYNLLVNTGCTPRQAYQIMLDLIIPLDRINGQTLSRRTEFTGISYASKQAIDALEIMGIKGPWRTINRAIKALTASQVTHLEKRNFPWINTIRGERILLSVHDIEHSLSQYWKFKHICNGGRGTLYVPYKKEA